MDANPRPDLTPWRVLEPENVRVVVDLDPGEPLAGSAGHEGEPAERFEGMLGFLSLFERLRQRQRDQAARQPIEPEGG